MGGTCDVREEPGKQKPRSCRAQELARSSAHRKMRGRKRTLAKAQGGRIGLEELTCVQNSGELAQLANA